MAPSKEDGTAAAADQLGTMSLGESVERKDNETEPTTKNGTPTKLLCSACGEKSDALKKCRNCQCVWYCDKECQNKHWKEHRKECKRIKKELDKRGGKLDLGTEKEVGPLGKLPPREECPICMRALPIHEALHTYYTCCGKTICGGCDLQHQMKNRERAAERGQTSVPNTCAFCREPLSKSDEERLTRLSKRVELKDVDALQAMAKHHGEGSLGLPVDEAKCIELHRQSAGLGFPLAHYQLGMYHHTGTMGLEQNEDEGLKYFEKAAEGGHLPSLHNLGCRDNENGEHVASMNHWRLAASGGLKPSMDNLIAFFEAGLFHHSDLSKTLQAFYRARAEVRSEHRDQHIKGLKSIGKYKEEYEW